MKVRRDTYIDNYYLDNLREVVDSNLPWGLILYGEEEEKFLEASTDPVLSAIWKVGVHGLKFITFKLEGQGRSSTR